jgi:hypothetical protein
MNIISVIRRILIVSMAAIFVVRTIEMLESESKFDGTTALIIRPQPLSFKKPIIEPICPIRSQPRCRIVQMPRIVCESYA